MTELDLELPGIATDLIAEFGKDIAYKIVGQSAYNPATSKTDRQELAFALKAIVEDKKEGKLLSVSGEAFGASKPGNADTFVCDGVAYVVADNGVTATYSGELVALYQILGVAQ